jgi:predicted amidohydrolase
MLKAAVVYMKPVFANPDANLAHAEKLIHKAALASTQIILFPEFFTTGFAVNDALIPAICKSSQVPLHLASLSQKYNIAIGGSYLYYDKEKKNIYNTFGLFFPSGETFFHNKDIPTALENFCYTNGDEISAFATPLGRIGIAMCWEQLRSQTVLRMQGQVDFVLAASCWWDFTPEDGEFVFQKFSPINQTLAANAPITFAKLLGVPVIHASCTGSFEGLSMSGSQKKCQRPICSKTLAVSADGNLLLPPSEQEGCYFVEFLPQKTGSKTSIPTSAYWIPSIPEPMLQGFYTLNQKYQEIYQRRVLPLCLQGDVSV